MADKPERTTAERLRKLIDDSGMTHSEVAEHAGMTKQQLSNVLNRDRSDPRISTVQKILTALGLDLCDFEKEQ